MAIDKSQVFAMLVRGPNLNEKALVQLHRNTTEQAAVKNSLRDSGPLGRTIWGYTDSCGLSRLREAYHTLSQSLDT